MAHRLLTLKITGGLLVFLLTELATQVLNTHHCRLIQYGLTYQENNA